MPPITAMPSDMRTPGGKYQRQHAGYEGKAGHQDRPEAQARRLDGGLADVHAFHPLAGIEASTTYVFAFSLRSARHPSF